MAEHLQKEQKEQEDNKKKRLLILLILLLLILVIALGVTVWSLFFRAKPALSPDYAPKEQEQYATDIGDGDGSKLAQADGGGAVNITYTTQIDIDLSENTASLYFANPSKSNQDAVLQIVVQDEIIAQSGTIFPGKQVEKLKLSDGAASKLTAGGYNGNFKVFYYQPDTHEKTIVNTEIPVNITVEQ